MKKILSVLLAILTVISTFSYSSFAAVIKPVFEINIFINSKIAGKAPEDWKGFISVNEESVEIGEEGLVDARYIDNVFSTITHKAELFEEGITYYGSIYIYAKEGHCFPDENFKNELTVFINGQDYGINSFKYIYSDNAKDIECIEVFISFKPEKPDPTGIAAIPKKIADFFMNIIIFITETFIQPIVDLII